MNIITVTSKSIAAIGYDESTMVLRIVFRNDGIYDYQGVPVHVFKQFMSSPSKGKYYVYHIKGRFNQVRIQ